MGFELTGKRGGLRSETGYRAEVSLPEHCAIVLCVVHKDSFY